MPHILEAFGLSERDGLVYEALLRRPGVDRATLSRACGMGSQKVADALAALEVAGLVTRTAGAHVRYVPAPPDTAVGYLVLKRQEALVREQQALEQVRMQAARLHREYLVALRADNPREVVGIITGVAGVQERHHQMQLGARSLVRHLDIAQPDAHLAPERPLQQTQVEQMHRGVVYQSVYEQEFVHRPGGLERILRYVAEGEDARVVREVPCRLTIVDDQVAIVSPPAMGDSDTAVVVTPSVLFDAMVALFDRYWAAAAPLQRNAGDDGAGLSSFDRRILALLAAGAKDEAIARQVRTSVATVRRRIAALLQDLHAATRFQAGLLAARRGWL